MFLRQTTIVFTMRLYDVLLLNSLSFLIYYYYTIS